MPRPRTRIAALGVVLAATLLAAPSATAQPAVAVIAGSVTDAIATFDTDAPGTLGSSRVVTGVLHQQRLVGIDYRWIPGPSGGGSAGLYGLGVNISTGETNLYRLSAATGVATPVGAGFSRAAGAFYGFDIDPAADRARIVSSGDDNYRVDLDTGALVAAAAALSPSGRAIAGAAYDRVGGTPSALAKSTLYVIDPIMDRLAIQGGADGAPGADSGGVVPVGSLGLDVSPYNLGFDIAYDGTALATFTVGGVAGLYRVDLLTGASTLIGPFTQPLTAFAVVPGTAQFATGAITTSERGSLAVEVTRTGATDAAATVRYATAGGSADPVTDYRATSGTLTFPAGAAKASFAVELIDDEAREDDETIGLALSDPSASLSVGLPSAATVTVIDDDGPAPKTLADAVAAATKAATEAAMATVAASSIPGPAPVAAPLPAPGGGSANVAVSDRAAPSLTVAANKRPKRAAFLRGAAVQVTTDERATITATLSAKVKRATAARAGSDGYNLELAAATLGPGAGTRALKLRPKVALFGRPTRRVLVRLTVTATDPSGNVATVVQTLAVTR